MCPIHQRLLIIDFGSQVTLLIARRMRELHIYCEVHPYQNVDVDFLSDFAPQAIILSGGPHSVMQANSPRPPMEIYKLSVPILGICYGQQVMMLQLGGRVQRGAASAEFGAAIITHKRQRSKILSGWFNNKQESVWMSHGDHVSTIANGFKVLAESKNAPFAIIADESRLFYGVQFHPEVHHTPKGMILLRNFTHLAGFCGDWTMETFQDTAINSIRAKVGDQRVICGLSGGVDSAVTAILVHQAIGDRLTCVLVDHGLLRQNEAQEVVTLFRDNYRIKLIVAYEQERFLTALKGQSDPEIKRKIIGKLFIDVFESLANKVGDVRYLAQGTLYPDVIESLSADGSSSMTIKSHHNVGGLPSRMRMRLVEPLRTLFKDEVRELGCTLGLPDAFVRRHPFPGPGLAIRCIGAITPQRIAIIRAADAIYLQQIHHHGLYDAIWQAYIALLPVQSVGVMGDARSYDYACVLRAVTSVDGMTADFYPFSAAFLSETATRIINEVEGINRVTYDITSKPPATIEWE